MANNCKEIFLKWRIDELKETSEVALANWRSTKVGYPWRKSWYSSLSMERYLKQKEATLYEELLRLKYKPDEAIAVYAFYLIHGTITGCTSLKNWQLEKAILANFV